MNLLKSIITLLILNIFFFALPAAAQDSAADEERVFDELMLAPECRPQYPGGESAFMKAVAAKMAIPPSAVDDGIRGRVTVKFTVRKDGKVVDVKVARGLRDDVDKACVAAVTKAGGEWTPGRIDGIPVNVSRNVTITVKTR